MKKIVLSSLVLGLVLGFTGCTDKEKKAKEIEIERIIKQDQEDKEFLKNMRKEDTRDWSNR